MKPTFISLFSGIGGFDLGLERAGWQCIAQCDNDPFCNKVLAKHWPGVMRYDDVRSITSAEGRRAGDGATWSTGRRGIDLICGGFPCQDLSVAGKRAGLDGERSGLWFEFHRILSELRPTFALIENVPGLLSSNEGRDFGIVLAGLGELWPAVGWAVLDSQHFGVAQRRRRVYVIAGPSRECVQQILSLCEGGDWHSAKGRAPGQDVAATIRGRSSSAGVNEPGRGGEDDANLVLAATLTSGGEGRRGHRGDDGTDTMVLANTLPGHHPRHDLDNDTYIPDVSPTLSRRDAKGPSSSVDQAALLVAHTLSADGFDASEDGTGRGTPLTVIQNATRGKAQNGIGVSESDVMYTLDGASQHAVGVRRLTPIETARLQGFPDGFTCICGGVDELRSILRVVWNSAHAQGLSDWQARELVLLCQKAFLQSNVRPTRKGSTNRALAPISEGLWAEICSTALRSLGLPELRDYEGAHRQASSRPRSPEQRPNECDGALRLMSLEAALAGGKSAGTSKPPEDNEPRSNYWQDCALLGLDGWCVCPDGPQYKAYGNAVSVPVIEYLGLRIKAVLS